MRENDYEDRYYVEVRRAPISRRGEPYYDPYSNRQADRFSDTEIQHLSVALIILTISFAFIFTDGIFFAMANPLVFAFLLIPSSIAVLTAFLCHELGHKFLAQKYGHWAEFRYNLQYLLLGLGLAAIIGWLIVAPGAVYIRGNPTREENGKISAAGPGINIIVAAVLVPIAFLLHSFTIIYFFALIIGFVNVFIAGFNMIPGWIFDGAKIWRWDKGIYFGMWGAIIALGVFHFGLYWGLITLF
ncbi:MAG: M50 family metallopeptidase [Thermoplasmata archaeon]|nr:M50 family metallopeptidase [Thermoplasmata archaeon]